MCPLLLAILRKNTVKHGVLAAIVNLIRSLMAKFPGQEMEKGVGEMGQSAARHDQKHSFAACKYL